MGPGADEALEKWELDAREKKRTRQRTRDKNVAHAPQNDTRALLPLPRSCAAASCQHVTCTRWRSGNGVVPRTTSCFPSSECSTIMPQPHYDLLVKLLLIGDSGMYTDNTMLT